MTNCMHSLKKRERREGVVVGMTNIALFFRLKTCFTFFYFLFLQPLRHSLHVLNIFATAGTSTSDDRKGNEMWKYDTGTGCFGVYFEDTGTFSWVDTSTLFCHVSAVFSIWLSCMIRVGFARLSYEHFFFFLSQFWIALRQDQVELIRKQTKECEKQWLKHTKV